MTWPLGLRKPVGGGQGTFQVFQSYGNNALWKEGGTETGKEGVKDRGKEEGRGEGGRQERKKRRKEIDQTDPLSVNFQPKTDI